MLISDPSTTTSAASMEVGVGSLHESKEHKGIATYLQHMLTSGAAIPACCDLNAYTSLNNTQYHLKCEGEDISGGLDKFAAMFAKPNFSDKNKAGVIKKIHHKFKTALVSDDWHALNLYM